MAIENEYYTIIPAHAAVCRFRSRYALLFLFCNTAATLLPQQPQLLPNMNSFCAMHEKGAAVNATTELCVPSMRRCTLVLLEMRVAAVYVTKPL